MRIGIIGVGVYSVALATALCKNKKNVINMWTESQDKCDEYNTKGCITGLLDGATLPSVNMFTDFDSVVNGVDLVIIGVAAHFLEDTMKKLAPSLLKKQVICIATKGIDAKNGAFLSDVVYGIYPTKLLAVISGPSFAVDVVSGEPIGLSVGSRSNIAIKTIAECFKGSNIKLRATKDIIGVQICGSVKNVIAVATGMLGGMGYSNSAQAFLITESLHDIKGLIKAVGGNPKTIMSYAGVGDLLLTCTSIKSRNYSFGKLVGSGASKEEIDKYLSETTVEGYYTLKSVRKLVRKRNIKLPIVDLIYNIIFNEVDLTLLVNFLYKKD